MTPEQFCYWLQGYAELAAGQVPTKAQWDSIREHLATVFKKVTPPVATPNRPLGDIATDHFKSVRMRRETDWPSVIGNEPPRITC